MKKSLTLRASALLEEGMKQNDSKPDYDDTPATTVEIVYTFMTLEHREITDWNWRTAPRDKQDRWNVNDETYINGVVLTVDGDFWMGYLIECVDRTSGVIAFLAINLYHGRRADGWFDHDFMTYEPSCGTFGGSGRCHGSTGWPNRSSATAGGTTTVTIGATANVRGVASTSVCRRTVQGRTRTPGPPA
jgi:hypothetical protein